MAALQTYTHIHRGWLHDSFGDWTDAQSIQHLVATGEAHEQFALVERWHAVLRKAVEVFLMDFGLQGANAIRALTSPVGVGTITQFSW